MALRGTLTHWKTQVLAKTLGIDLSHALGLLESLWHVTAEKTPSGNIGRMDNKAIAMQMFTRIKPDKLIDALIVSKHLDPHPVHRLLVHDWARHADYNTKRKVSRNNETIFTTNGEVEPLTPRDASSRAIMRPPDASIQMPDAREKDDNTVVAANPVSSSSSLNWTHRTCQKCWNRWRGPMKESKYLGLKHAQLFKQRLEEGLTEEISRQVIVRMASTPHFIGETTGWIADFYWLLGTHKDSGEANFRKVLNGDYDPRKQPRKPVKVIGKAPSYKELEHRG